MTDTDGAESTAADVGALETQLAAANRQIAHLRADLDGFLHLAAHDLKEPARQLQAFAELIPMQASQPGGVQQDVIDQVVAAAARLEALVRDLVGLYSQTIGSSTRTPIALAECVDDVVRRLDPMIVIEGATVHVDPLPTGLGDRVLLTRVFENLITNALKYRSPRPPRIHVFSVPAGQPSEVVVAIADNGRGIPAADLERVFEPFVRLDETATDGGTGVGLAAVRRIMGRLGGRVWVESDTAGGTTFFLSLPAIGSDQGVGPAALAPSDSSDEPHAGRSAEAAELSAASSVDFAGVRLLLVEDSDADARVVAAALANHDPERFEVVRVETLRDALHQMDTETFDAVLTDLNLPDSRDVDTLDAIVAAASMPVVVLTVLDDGATGRAAIASGAQDFVVKHHIAYTGLGRIIVHALDRHLIAGQAR